MRRSIWIKIGAHSTWLCMVILSFYFSWLCAKIESHAVTLVVCSPAYKVKSGSHLHDSRLAMIYRSNLGEIQRLRNGFLGGFAYWVIVERRSLKRHLEWALAE